MHGGWMSGWQWVGGILMMIIPLILLGTAIGLAVFLALRAAGGFRGPGRSAMDILDERLARGEISLEEWRKLRQELQQRR